jgi:hypothetical protein
MENAPDRAEFRAALHSTPCREALHSTQCRAEKH